MDKERGHRERFSTVDPFQPCGFFSLSLQLLECVQFQETNLKVSSVRHNSKSVHVHSCTVTVLHYVWSSHNNTNVLVFGSQWFIFSAVHLRLLRDDKCWHSEKKNRLSQKSLNLISLISSWKLWFIKALKCCYCVPRCNMIEAVS